MKSGDVKSVIQDFTQFVSDTMTGAFDTASLKHAQRWLDPEQSKFVSSIAEIQKSALYKDDKKQELIRQIIDGYDGTNQAIKNTIPTLNAAAVSTDDLTKSLANQNMEMAIAPIKAAAWNLAVSAAIMGAVALINYLMEREEKARQKAAEAMEQYTDMAASIDGYVEEYGRLNDIVLDSASTVEEVESAKESLLEIQQTLIDTYGDEARGIDLVNGKYSDQLALLRELQAEEAHQYIKDNKVALDKISKQMNGEYRVVLGGEIGEGYLSDDLRRELDKLAEQYEYFKRETSEQGLNTIVLDTTVKQGYDSLNEMYDAFEGLKRYVSSEVETNWIDGMLSAISTKMNEWKDEYSEGYDTYEKYGAASIAALDGMDNVVDGTRISTAYKDYADAVQEYNAALLNGTQADIDTAKRNLDEAQSIADAVQEQAEAARDGVYDAGGLNSFGLNGQQTNAIIDAFARIGEQIDTVTEQKNALLDGLEQVWNGNQSSLQLNSNTESDTTQSITKQDLKNIKELKMSQAEFRAMLNTDEGAQYFEKLSAAIEGTNLELTDVIAQLALLGLFSDIDTPISDEDLELFAEYADVIEDVVNSSRDYASLTEAEKTAIDRWNESATNRNLIQQKYFDLCSQQQALKAAQEAAAFAKVNDDLVSATRDAANAMEDLDTITKVVNGDMCLTDEQAAGLVSRHEELADVLSLTSDGWTLESEAMDSVTNASNVLQSAYITAQQAMNEMLTESVRSRLEELGIELEGIQNLADAYALLNTAHSDAQDKVKAEYEKKGLTLDNWAKDAYTFSDATLNGKAITQNDVSMIKRIGALQGNMTAAKARMDALLKRLGSVGGSGSSGGAGSSKAVERYVAEIDKLYKALERQKEIEEDITDIQRKRDGLEDDDYSGRIKNIYQEIDATNQLNATLHEQNEIRRTMIRSNIEMLKQYGFSVSYNAAYNELLVNNYEDLNTIATAYAKRQKLGTEATNEFVQSVEDLISETHDLNDANKENSASWQDNTQAVKDYLKEIKELKAEMVDDFMGKRKNYLSFMEDFELWDQAEVNRYLESMLNDLTDFYNAGLIEYESYVEQYNEIAKDLFDARKDSLESILDMVEEIVKRDLDDEVDGLEEQKDRLNDIVDLKKKILELTKEENDYNKSLQEKVKEIAKLQARIAQLELDDSREAAAEKATLLDQLAELQSELDDTQYDHSVEKQEEALDEMADNQSDAIDKEIEKIEDLANDALYIHDRVIEYIRDNWDTLLQDLIDYNNAYGDGIEQNVVEMWNTAYDALVRYKDEAGTITTGQAAYDTVTPIAPENGGAASDVIVNGTVPDLVRQMKANSLKWPSADDPGKKELEKANDSIAQQIEQLTGKTVERKNDGVWYINGEKLYEKYDKYHTGGTVGEKDNEIFALLKKGEDVLTDRQQAVAAPLMKAGLEMFNLSEGARSILELIKRNAAPNLSGIGSANQSLVMSPEINITVSARGNAKDIAEQTKESVMDGIAESFSKMGITSRFRGVFV